MSVNNNIKILSISTLITLCSASVQSAEMRPLLKAMEDNPPEQALAYAGRRCSALFLAMMNRYQNSGRNDPDMQTLIKGFETKYMEWAMVGLKLTMNEPANQNSPDFFQKSVIRTAKAYGEVWDRNFDVSGNSFGSMTQEDSQSCNQLMELIKGAAKK